VNSSYQSLEKGELIMHQKLGICVNSRKYLHHVIGIAKAAKDMGKEVEIFFTGEGVLLTQDPRFKELPGIGRIGVCEVSYISNGLKGKVVPGLEDKDFVTQARNAEMVEECDRFLIF
jgi:peroxiredoxin family protein